MIRTTGHTACAWREVAAGGAWLERFERLRAGPWPWLLDSALPSARLGRHSFAGSDPYLVVRAWGRRVVVDCRRAVRPGLAAGRTELVADPFEVVRSLLPPPPDPGPPAQAPPFVGGAVGSLGYELAQQLEPLQLGAVDEFGLPDLQLLFVDHLLAHDHADERTTAWALGFAADRAAARGRAEALLDRLADRLAAPPPAPASPAPAVAAPRGGRAFFDADSYAKAIHEAKQEIAAGNVYQVCLTQRRDWDAPADGWDLYRRLRAANPAPFGCYLELAGVTLLGSSPERFLRLDAAGGVESRPIKGTRPRGANPTEDRANRNRLACSDKERAENLMIVDLVRNDLGRVCETGSIDVPELMAIEAYAAVFQMVSTVQGRLRRDRDGIDLVRAAFPPGSMTGAPKIAAMRIIDRLEPVRRGPYSGAVGYFDVRGGLDLCVVIRTALLVDGRASVHAGGGIVADSEPLAEWRETLDKARPLAALLAPGGD